MAAMKLTIRMNTCAAVNILLLLNHTKSLAIHLRPYVLVGKTLDYNMLVNAHEFPKAHLAVNYGSDFAVRQVRLSLISQFKDKKHVQRGG